MQKLAGSLIFKFATVIVIAVLANAPAAYACSQQGCVAPCNYEALMYDHSFTQGCNKWKTANGATITTSGGGYASLTPTSGGVYQDLVVGSYSSMELTIFIGGVTGTPGSEFYRLVITNTSGYPLQYVDIFWPGDNPSGRYDYSLNNFSGQTIRVRIQRVQGSAPGTTTMTVDSMEVWGFF